MSTCFLVISSLLRSRSQANFLFKGISNQKQATKPGWIFMHRACRCWHTNGRFSNEMGQTTWNWRGGGFWGCACRILSEPLEWWAWQRPQALANEAKCAVQMWTDTDRNKTTAQLIDRSEWVTQPQIRMLMTNQKVVTVENRVCIRLQGNLRSLQKIFNWKPLPI